MVGWILCTFFPYSSETKGFDILSTIEFMNCQWQSNEVHGGTTTKTIQALRDALWYTDGAHDTLAERATLPTDI